MAWNVWGPVVTVATGSSVITWTEVVHLDVTQGCMARHVMKVYTTKVNFTLIYHISSINVKQILTNSITDKNNKSIMTLLG